MRAVERLAALPKWRGRGLDFTIGLLTVGGHAPFHIWPLAFLGFAYLMLRLDSARRAQTGGFSKAMWFGLGYFIASTFWIGSAFIVRGPEFIPVMPPMVFGLAALLAIFWGFAGWAFVKFSGASSWRWLALAGLLTLAEFGRGVTFGGFPWNLPGYIFKAGGAFSQTAAITGIYGLSFIVLLLSAGLAKTLSGKAPLKTSLLCAMGLGILFGGGQYRLSKAKIDYVDDVNIRLVQVPFSQKDKFYRDSAIAIVNDFIRLSISPGAENVTHVVWPEGAVNGIAVENEDLLNAMGMALTSIDDTPPYWLLNSLRTELHPVIGGSPKLKYFNTSAAIGFDQNGTPAIMSFNDKYRLVPFGEFIPGGQLMEEFGSKTLSTSLASISPAPSKELASFPGLPKVSPQICYEIIFSRLTPRPKEKRPEWILNQSNDAWYGRSTGPAQHANISAYRAIEEAMPVVRAASNGVTGVVDPYGRYINKLGAQETGIIDVRLPRPLSKTYLANQHNLALFLIILSISVIATFIRRP